MFLVPVLWFAVLAQDEVPLRKSQSATTTPERVEQRGKDGVNDRAVMDVSNPSITVYLPPKDKATGVGILICPGGGYARLAIDKEGHDVARWLNTIGVAGFVLKYRLPGSANMRPSLGTLQEATTAASVAIEDATDAMKIIRAKWNLQKVGMMGFSAGGHLAAMLGMTAEGTVRPDFLALIYPAVPKELKIDASTPRSFLVHADDDGLSAGENSARFYQLLRQAKVRSELHVYSDGGHGFGIKQSGKASAAWPGAFELWLKTMSKT
jgi:acetyl esterase/lipase